MLSLPPDFDAGLYVGRPDHQDLKGMGPEEAALHYQNHGEREGRICNTVPDRAAFLALVDARESLLEIGPFFAPAFARATHQVSYLDVLSTEDLRARALAVGGSAEAVPHIDFVWRGGAYKDLVTTRFAGLFSSHNLEHQPCLVAHLQDAASVLAPGGRFFLAIPDKRYCFDHFLRESTVADVLDAHLSKRTRHTARSAIEHWNLTTHNDPARHWQGLHGPDTRFPPADPQSAQRLLQSLQRLHDDPGYLDVHAWQFTPQSFRAVFELLSAAALIPFKVERVYGSVRGANEFYAVLSSTAGSLVRTV